jgi:methyl-accepting chemotaxis protein
MKLNAIMKWLPYVFIGLLVFFAIDLTKKNNELVDSIQSFQIHFDEEKNANKIKFDSLSNLLVDYNSKYLELKTLLPEIEKNISQLNAKANERKKDIERITDSDSLSLFFARRYKGAP